MIVEQIILSMHSHVREERVKQSLVEENTRTLKCHSQEFTRSNNKHTVEPRLSGPRLSGLSCDLKNSKSQKAYSVLFCALFKIRKCDETKKYSDAFCWYMVGSIVLLPREFHAWLVPSTWVM